MACASFPYFVVFLMSREIGDGAHGATDFVFGAILMNWFFPLCSKFQFTVVFLGCMLYLYNKSTLVI
jgi:hypothetical protein